MPEAQGVCEYAGMKRSVLWLPSLLLYALLAALLTAPLRGAPAAIAIPDSHGAEVAEAVLRDVADGFVSVEAAARLYGVIIREGELDLAATAAARAARPASRAFHRTEYVDALV